jgi:broad specificity phosphatase PhoE
MKVTLIRHGRPAADLSTRITGREFAAWLATYDCAGVDPALPPPGDLVAALADCRLLLTSPTRRARESAQLLATDCSPQVEPAAVEAPLPTSLAWPFPIRPAALTVIARLLWLLRLAPTAEKHTLVRLRAQRLADRLTDRSRAVGPVALVGHGYMHVFTRRSLENSGWKCVHARGHGYWSHAQFER